MMIFKKLNDIYIYIIEVLLLPPFSHDRTKLVYFE